MALSKETRHSGYIFQGKVTAKAIDLLVSYKGCIHIDGKEFAVYVPLLKMSVYFTRPDSA